MRRHFYFRPSCFILKILLLHVNFKNYQFPFHFKSHRLAVHIYVTITLPCTRHTQNETLGGFVTRKADLLKGVSNSSTPPPFSILTPRSRDRPMRCIFNLCSATRHHVCARRKTATLWATSLLSSGDAPLTLTRSIDKLKGTGGRGRGGLLDNRNGARMAKWHGVDPYMGSIPVILLDLLEWPKSCFTDFSKNDDPEAF